MHSSFLILFGRIRNILSNFSNFNSAHRQSFGWIKVHRGVSMSGEEAYMDTVGLLGWVHLGPRHKFKIYWCPASRSETIVFSPTTYQNHCKLGSPVTISSLFVPFSDPLYHDRLDIFLTFAGCGMQLHSSFFINGIHSRMWSTIEPAKSYDI